MSNNFVIGQRWISDAETDLGLGTIIQVEGRQVTLAFPASGEQRTYAQASAPLTRIRFTVGDNITSQEGATLRVGHVEEIEGLLHYSGTNEDGIEQQLSETGLSHSTQINRPQERLLTGQLDDPGWFDLRYQTLRHLQRLESSTLLGLGGVRTELLPHQLYIAHEVSRRYAPRVLLADEVGLGKTIEACLILHAQILTGQVERVLILVPDSLLHQWLVELLRRFNLRFSLFDEKRCQAITGSDELTNPFHAEQWVLASLSMLTENPERAQQAIDGEWDLVVVDEAHHLAWSSEAVSPEYRVVEALAARYDGLILLTATPEQLGREGHFARLRLLDPNRFFDLDSFLQEESQYAPVAEAVADLLDQNTPIERAGIAPLLERLGEAQNQPLLERLHDTKATPEQRDSARSHLIELLLDRHGTGRILFRNTRNRIKGFPKRQLHTYPLPLPEAYEQLITSEDTDPRATLTPEVLYRHQPGKPWHEIDSRLDWLVNTLRRHPEEKVLLICANGQTAIELNTALRTREGIASALFHEGMSLIERDRAAAWFADPEEGCQLLICSEIGSEGRNFQFAANLILFDLPFNPDLLEQRIGRLDRIGQRETIQIHVPYFEDSGQAHLLRWLDEGVGIFHTTSPTAQALFTRLQPVLLDALEINQTDAAQVDQLIESTIHLRKTLEAELQRGRDHLLEINSCREPQASQLKQQLESEETTPPLADYLEQLLTQFGVEIEEHSPGNIILRPGNHMLVEALPGLEREGMTGTFQRTTALQHEERHYLTWEHPLTRGCIDTLMNLETGRSSVAILKHPSITGGLLLEMLFVLECPAPSALQVGRFLPTTPIRLLLDQKGRDRTNIIAPDELPQALTPLPRSNARQLIQSLRHLLMELIAEGERQAVAIIPEIIETAIHRATNHYADESERLLSLRQVNPNVRDEEITGLMAQIEAIHHHLLQARVHMDAIRLIISR